MYEVPGAIGLTINKRQAKVNRSPSSRPSASMSPLNGVLLLLVYTIVHLLTCFLIGSTRSYLTPLNAQFEKLMASWTLLAETDIMHQRVVWQLCPWRLSNGFFSYEWTPNEMVIQCVQLSNRNLISCEGNDISWQANYSVFIIAAKGSSKRFWWSLDTSIEQSRADTKHKVKK